MEQFLSGALAAHWLWVGLGLLLIFAELATGSLFLLWPGVAALLAAAIAYFAPETPLALQLGAFALLSLALTWIGRHYFRVAGPAETDRPLLNQRSKQLVGRRVSAVDAFENGYGAVRLDDTQWSARLADGDFAEIGADATLEIVDVEGARLVVKAV